MIQTILVFVALGFALGYLVKKTLWDVIKKQKTCSTCSMNKQVK